MTKKWKFKTVPPLMGTGTNVANRKVSKTITGKDESGQETSYIVALYRGGALGQHESQSIRIWYNYSQNMGRYKASTVIFCALDMEEKACEVYESINTEDDVKHRLAVPLIFHTGRWW